MKSAPLGILLLMLLMGSVSAPSADAGWVWSPQTGWIGPSGAVKDTPEEQLAFAIGFFEQQDYDRARKEFKKLLKAYEHSPQAPEAQYYLGRCAEEESSYYTAFLEYRRTIQVYPSTMRFDEILEHEYQIANYFQSGKKRKLFGIAAILPARDKAIEIFEAIVEDGPFSKYGELAQYKLGLAHVQLRNYAEAVAAFEQVITRYPASELVDDARYQIALASLKGTFSAGYDQSPTDLAIRELDAFHGEYPSSELLEEAEQRRVELFERRAEHEYEVGQFYEQRERPRSALTCYQALVREFPGTPWTEKASERIRALEPLLEE